MRSIHHHIGYLTLATLLAAVAPAFAKSLPASSVGKRELKRHAVTTPKIAPGAVTRETLSDDVQSALDAAGTPGPTGPQGEPGPAGVPGTPGPGAAAIRYATSSSATPTPQIVLDFQGLRLTATCQQSGTQTSMGFAILSAEGGTVHDHFDLDFGTDPHAPGESQSGTLLFEVQPGVEAQVGPPPIEAPNYGRVFATILYAAPTRTLQLTVVLLVDAGEETCSLTGVAIPTS